MHIKSFGMTDQGLVREANEDTLVIDEAEGVYIVCDGMGGAVHGKVASDTAATSVLEFIRERRSSLESLEGEERILAAVRIVKGAIEAACQKMKALIEERPDFSGMGTTLTMVFIDGTDAIMGHVGDSRLYLKRDGMVHQLSQDHTLVAELVRLNEITEAEALEHEFSQVLTRAVGYDASVMVDTLHFEVLPDDLLLLCSDGFWSYRPYVEEIAPLMETSDLEGMAAEMISVAKDGGGSDNITTLLVEFSENATDGDNDRQRQEYVNLQFDVLQKVYLFSDMQMGEICKIINISRVQKCAAGDVLIQEGEESSRLFIILDGEVAVQRGGKEICKFGTGNHFGEMALLSSEARSASVSCVSESQLLTLDQASLYQLTTQEPALGVHLLWKLGAELSNRLTAANLHFTDQV